MAQEDAIVSISSDHPVVRCMSQWMFWSTTPIKKGMDCTTTDAAPAAAPFWDLTHVLQFGGLAVRDEDQEDTSLVKRILLQLLGSSGSGGHTNKGKGVTELTERQVADLLTLLCSHMDFRYTADRPIMVDDDEDDTSTERERWFLMHVVFKLNCI
jgi:hypothetical protein